MSVAKYHLRQDFGRSYLKRKKNHLRSKCRQLEGLMLELFSKGGGWNFRNSDALGVAGHVATRFKLSSMFHCSVCYAACVLHFLCWLWTLACEMLRLDFP